MRGLNFLYWVIDLLYKQFVEITSKQKLLILRITVIVAGETNCNLIIDFLIDQILCFIFKISSNMYSNDTFNK